LVLLTAEPMEGAQRAQAWLAYGLIAAGWILAITIAAGITRALHRQ
jgi:hypothetical protein